MKKLIVVMLVLVSVMSIGLLAKPFEFTAGAVAETSIGINDITNSNVEFELDDVTQFGIGVGAKVLCVNVGFTAFPRFEDNTAYINGMVDAGLSIPAFFTRIKVGVGLNYLATCGIGGSDFAFQGGSIENSKFNIKAGVDMVLDKIDIGVNYVVPTNLTINGINELNGFGYIVEATALKNNILNGTFGLFIGLNV